MTVNVNQQCPFVGVVLTNRQKSKAVQGTQVEVRHIKEGQFGPYAIAFAAESTDPVFLSLKNLGFVSEVSEERLVKIEAERSAWRAQGSTPVVIGTNPDWESDKAVGFDWTLDQNEYGVKRVRLFFPKSQRDGKPIYNHKAGTVPQWIWDTKEREHNRDGEKLTVQWGA